MSRVLVTLSPCSVAPVKAINHETRSFIARSEFGAEGYLHKFS